MMSLNSKISNLIRFLILTLILSPNVLLADRGLIVWPPTISLEQSAQNAIVAWNGKEEIIVLSTNLKSTGKATALEVLPLPTNPKEIKEGDPDIFQKLVNVFNKKLIQIARPLGLESETKSKVPGVEIVLEKQIGPHDITVVKVNEVDVFLDWISKFAKEKNLAEKTITINFITGIKNYLKRDIKYFVFDVINVENEEQSVKPLVYRFDSEFLYFPMLISGVSEFSPSRASFNIFNIIPKGMIPSGVNFSNVELNKDELKEVSEELAELFDSDVLVRRFFSYSFLKDLTKDIHFYSKIFNRNLKIGDRGEDVKALQKILINEGVWDSEIEATGYFGSITQRSLIKFQEKYNFEILSPLGLKSGTGFFGLKTREFLASHLY